MIHEECGQKGLYEKESYTCIRRDGQKILEEKCVLAEHRINIYVNGKFEETLVCSPQYLTELVLGHLYTEGQIGSIEEIKSIRMNESGEQAEVELCLRERTEVCFLEPVKLMKWKEEWIFALADRFAEGMPVHNKTWGTHSCFLAREGEILFECEDIGRHNAFDKVIGYAVSHDINLETCMVYSSGRISAEMVKKAIRAGVPIFVSKAVPTAEALRLAKKYRLTLIGSARQDRMNVYSGVDCLLGESMLQ